MRKEKEGKRKREKILLFKSENIHFRDYTFSCVLINLIANLDDAHDLLKIVQTRRSAIFLVSQLSKSPFSKTRSCSKEKKNFSRRRERDTFD